MLETYESMTFIFQIIVADWLKRRNTTLTWQELTGEFKSRVEDSVVNAVHEAHVSKAFIKIQLNPPLHPSTPAPSPLISVGLIKLKNDKKKKEDIIIIHGKGWALFSHWWHLLREPLSIYGRACIQRKKKFNLLFFYSILIQASW